MEVPPRPLTFRVYLNVFQLVSRCWTHIWTPVFSSYQWRVRLFRSTSDLFLKEVQSSKKWPASTRAAAYSCSLRFSTSAHCIHYAFSSWVQPAEYQKITWFSESRPPSCTLWAFYDADDSRMMSPSAVVTRAWLTVPRLGNGFIWNALYLQRCLMDAIKLHTSSHLTCF